MSMFRPIFNNVEPGWEDGCGFRQRADSTSPAPTAKEIRGSLILPQNQAQVTVIFNTPLPLNTDYDVFVSTENQKTGGPDEQIFPTELISRTNDGTHEVGFVYGLNAGPTTGPGTTSPLNQPNSYTKFDWKIVYYP